jgi:[methyl-Co(III) methanol-specific corrinoid protein]:coenzyme M methyltransferase
MNSLERILAALNHEQADRIPVTGFLTAVTAEMMEQCGFNWAEAHYDAEKLVKLAAAAHEQCGLETIKLPFDMTAEAEALGGRIDAGTADTLPQLRHYLFDEPEEFAFSADFIDKGRIPVILESINIAKARYSPDAAVVSSIVGPFTLGTKLFGIENFLVWVALEPEKVREAMKKLTDFCIIYAQEQINAGSDIILIGEAAASGDLISPDTYRDFIAPYHKSLCKGLAAPSVVHICGNIDRHLPYIFDTGMTGISFDAKTDIKKAYKLLKGKTALIGYVDTMLLLKGSPELVYSASEECIEAGVDCLNAGCALPAHVKTENILAMIKAVN